MKTTPNLQSALAKVRARFPHLAGEPDEVVAQNACRLIVPGLSGPELLALAKKAGPIETPRRKLGALEATRMRKLRQWGAAVPTERVVLSLPKPFAKALKHASEEQGKPRGAVLLDLIGEEKAKTLEEGTP